MRYMRILVKRFKSGDFSLIDKQRPGEPRKYDDLKQVLAENSVQI